MRRGAFVQSTRCLFVFSIPTPMLSWIDVLLFGVRFILIDEKIAARGVIPKGIAAPLIGDCSGESMDGDSSFQRARSCDGESTD